MPITGLDEDVQRIAAEVLTDAANALMDDLMAEAPRGDTFELIDSAYGPEVDEQGLTAKLGFDAPQADFTDQGTRPHDIYPVHADALTFYWENGYDGPGIYHFKHVNHPGQEGTGWFSDKVEDWQGYVDDAARDV